MRPFSFGLAKLDTRIRRRMFAMLVLATVTAGAQPSPATSQEPAAQIAVRVELVNLDITVTDARGNYVRNLTRENFRILDEGEPQPITHFASVEAPAQVLLLVETSPAVYLIHRQHLTAAHLLLQGLAAGDAVALATYDSEARIAAPFTLDKDGLQRQIAGLRYNLGNSHLNFFGSLAAALDWLAATPGKKSIVLLTTGLDDGPPARWEALAEKLRSSEAAIFPVALGGELRDPPKKNQAVSPDALQVAESFAQANRRLQEIAELSGGLPFFPRTPEDFTEVYRDIATVLRHTYTLGFAPPRRDGQFHRVRLEIVDPEGRLAKKGGGFAWHVRKGYLAPQP